MKGAFQRLALLVEVKERVGEAKQIRQWGQPPEFFTVKVDEASLQLPMVWWLVWWYGMVPYILRQRTRNE